MKQQILCTVLAAMMLTGCAAEPQNSIADTTAPAESTSAVETTAATTAEGTASVSETAAQTIAAAENPADGTMPHFVIVPAPAETYTAVTAAAQTQPAVTTSAKPNYQLRFSLPLALNNLFDYEKSADLAGTGIVRAPSGLRLHEKTSVNSNTITTLKDGTAVEILGVAATLDTEYDYDTEPNSFNQRRWFRIKADGKEGYASADYITAKFTQSPAELSKRQLRILVSFTYFQAQNLYIKFARDGGFGGRGLNAADSFTNDQGTYQQVQPDSLKLSDIYDEFYQYFSKNYHQDILNQRPAGKPAYYIEKDGKLYANTSFDSHTKWLDWDDAGAIIENGITDTEIKAKASWRYLYDYKKDQYGNALWVEPEYSLVYEDGYWKIGKFTPIYDFLTVSPQ